MEPVVVPFMTLGVTGGIGSGKSTLCRMLEELGAIIYRSDDVARKLMEEDEEIRREVVQAFGKQSYKADGSLDRAYLGGLVFESQDLLERLNATVHPRVHKEYLRQAKNMPGTLVVYEAALIYESGADKYLNMVAVVDAPLEERYDRVMRRDGLSREAIKARMRHQLPRKEILRRADRVICNGGTIEDLRRKAAKLFDAVTSLKPTAT